MEQLPESIFQINVNRLLTCKNENMAIFGKFLKKKVASLVKNREVTPLVLLLVRITKWIFRKDFRLKRKTKVKKKSGGSIGRGMGVALRGGGSVTRG